jgi:hypothetical protein
MNSPSCVLYQSTAVQVTRAVTKNRIVSRCFRLKRLLCPVQFTPGATTTAMCQLPADSATIVRYVANQACARPSPVVHLPAQVAGYNPISTSPEPLLGGHERKLGTARKGKAPAVTEDMRAVTLRSISVGHVSPHLYGS